jgi:hypothetical protein
MGRDKRISLPYCSINYSHKSMTPQAHGIEERILDTNVEKQLYQAATDV